MSNNSNLIRCKIGNIYLIWRVDWDYGKVIEVEILAKADSQVKVRVISEGFFRVGEEHWLPTNRALSEYWICWGKTPTPTKE